MSLFWGPWWGEGPVRRLERSAVTQGPLAAGAGGAGLAPVGKDGDRGAQSQSPALPPTAPGPTQGWRR